MGVLSFLKLVPYIYNYQAPGLQQHAILIQQSVLRKAYSSLIRIIEKLLERKISGSSL
jgi:hypothetical protein